MAGAAARLWRDSVRSAKIPSEQMIAGCRSQSGMDDLILDEELGGIAYG